MKQTALNLFWAPGRAIHSYAFRP